jgi:multiple sugar transport system ATP-binding protein
VSVELRGVGKRFGQVSALSPTNLAVRDRELLVLLGPSGCGKSTLLRLVAGLEEPTEGQVWIGGKRVDDVDPKDRDVAMVFQGYALYPHLTVAENLGYPLARRRVARAERDRRVLETARTLGLEPLLGRRPGELSGGERQRVAMGRALVRQPRVFLFDEPLSNLDARLRAELRGEIARLHALAGATSLYVTHDQIEAMALGDRIAVLRAGRIEQLGTPREVYDRPATRFVAEFVGTPPMSFLPARREGDRLVAGPISVPASGADPDRLELGVRPEHLHVEPADDTTDEGASPHPTGCGASPHPTGCGASPHPTGCGVVARVEPLGPDAHVLVALDDRTVQARLAAADAPAPGTRVRIWVAAEHVHRFDARTGARLV